MIGLKRGTVKLIPHHKQWAPAFAREKKHLLAKIGHFVISIEHIGSTAVPGLHAKPIIDISVGVARLKDAKKLIKPLREIGYNFDRTFGKQIFLAKGPDSRRTHYLHVMKYNGAKWRTDMLFREFLPRNPRHAKEYTALKKKLARQFKNNRQEYSDGKDLFIKETIGLAKRALKHS